MNVAYYYITESVMPLFEVHLETSTSSHDLVSDLPSYKTG